MRNKNLRECLATLCHEQWSRWQCYLFSKCSINRQGDCVIPRELYKRWYRQMKTAYDNLPENEQESDRIEARKVLDVIEQN